VGGAPGRAKLERPGHAKSRLPFRRGLSIRALPSGLRQSPRANYERLLSATSTSGHRQREFDPFTAIPFVANG